MFTLRFGIVAAFCGLLRPAQACDCGQVVQNRIVNGHDISRGDYPWMGVVKKDGNFRCGASLISNKYAITAYHCVTERVPDGFVLLLGGYDLDETYPESVEVPVENIIMYDDGTNHDRFDDIALLQLKDEVEFNSYIQPICIPKFGQNFAGDRAVIIGYGDTTGDGTYSDVPLAGEVSVTNNEFCNTVIARRNGGPVNDKWLCAGMYHGEPGICPGDSGSPLMYYNQDESKWEIIGIAAGTMGCKWTGDYNFWVNVTLYTNWIQDNSGEAGCEI